MKNGERFRRPAERAPAFALRPSYGEDFRKAEGGVVIELRDSVTGALEERREIPTGRGRVHG